MKVHCPECNEQMSMVSQGQVNMNTTKRATGKRWSLKSQLVEASADDIAHMTMEKVPRVKKNPRARYTVTKNPPIYRMAYRCTNAKCRFFQYLAKFEGDSRADVLKRLNRNYRIRRDQIIRGASLKCAR